MRHLKELFALLKETFTQWLGHKAPRLAAALAYYMVFSLSPMIIIAIAIAGAIFGEDAARGQIVAQMSDVVGEEAANIMERAIANASRPDLSNFASLISLGVLFFAASGVFAQLQDALNTIWGVQPKPGLVVRQFIVKRIISFAIVVGIGFLVILSLFFSAAITTLIQLELIPGLSELWQYISTVISFVLTTILFALIFRFLPDAKVSWSDVWIGAIITSVLFGIGRWLLEWYFARTGFGSTYGAAGSLIVLLAWVYYSAQILFLGAEFTEVYARKYGSRITPNRYSVKVTTTPIEYPEEDEQ
ncbi:YihY/virulence factor BrkB family protein [Euhalothece natronophila]|uniref:YihY/virulence factor BrkB family protein n=1 Tax=Euhalothece natronophila TaxID=577489 RepID=UPI001C98EF71|nr:YihY/virulence factor BrkB family protein [Euhalothece natronophila]